MELEFQQLELRYQNLRVRRPDRERRLLASLAEVGQQIPILVVPDPKAERFVVIDGYKRVRSLRKLVQDTVAATRLDLRESEALVISRAMRISEGETALEQAWLLDELHSRFGLEQAELARCFDRSVSWVSRRLALSRELPETVQERVRRGELVAHGAVKYLVPLARANCRACERLVERVSAARLTSRELGLLYGAWRDGTSKTRERLLADPLVLLKALKQAQAEGTRERSPADRLLGDVEALGAIARRAHRQLREGVAQQLMAEDRDEMRRSLDSSLGDVKRLHRRARKEMGDAGSESTGSDSGTAGQGAWHPVHSPGDEGVSGCGAQGAAGGDGRGARAGAQREGRALP